MTLAPGDLLRVSAVGLRTRPLRATLSALGVAIGVAAMLTVVGIAASGRADLEQELDRLGTNLLSVSAGSDIVMADATVFVGAIAGLYPAGRAARLSPADALGAV